MLPKNAQARKSIPVFSGVLKYFPAALAEVALLSKQGNDQHNPGKPLHWDRAKSQDEQDALVRHLLDEIQDRQDADVRIIHARAVAWRALAHLQKLCEERDRAYETDDVPAQPYKADQAQIDAYLRSLNEGWDANGSPVE
jgi:hypothetical protein